MSDENAKCPKCGKPTKISMRALKLYRDDISQRRLAEKLGRSKTYVFGQVKKIQHCICSCGYDLSFTIHLMINRMRTTDAIYKEGEIKKLLEITGLSGDRAAEIEKYLAEFMLLRRQQQLPIIDKEADSEGKKAIGAEDISSQFSQYESERETDND